MSEFVMVPRDVAERARDGLLDASRVAEAEGLDIALSAPSIRDLDVTVLLRREPLAAITSLDGTVREPLICLTVPERDAVLSALAASPQPVVGDREAVARIISPSAFEPETGFHYTVWQNDTLPVAREKAFAKADAILASLASRPEGNQELNALQAASQPSVPGGDGDAAVLSRPTGVRLEGRMDGANPMMRVILERADGSEAEIIQDNGTIISHWARIP